MRLSNAFTLEQAAALWCGGDPGADVETLRAAAPCFTIKSDLILQAVMSGLLPVTRDGDGVHQPAGSVSRQRMRIMRADLVRWFESLPTGDRPLFLFGDETDEMPDVSEAAEMNADRAIAVMAWLLAASKPAMMLAGKPNASTIGEAVRIAATKAFGEDVRGLTAFHKRISKAVKTFKTDQQAGVSMWSKK